MMRTAAYRALQAGQRCRIRTRRESSIPLLSSNTTRCFSDRLLGFSPMAPAVPIGNAKSKGEGGMPSASDVSTVGGVWAPTSAKRDKIAELKTELKTGQKTLDDAASKEQTLDLYLADGTKLVAKAVDRQKDVESITIRELQDKIDQELVGDDKAMIGEEAFKEKAASIVDHIEKVLTSLPASDDLKNIRNFYDPSGINEADLDTSVDNLIDAQGEEEFESAVQRMRLHLAKAVIEHFENSWAILTTVSDADVDRAATKHEEVERQISALSADKLRVCIHAFLSGNCDDRVDTVWALIDHDDDGLLEEAEMNNVAYLAVAPVENALVAFLDEALDAYPVRAEFPPPEPEAEGVLKKNGFFARRREKKAKKSLSKMFVKTTQNHFQSEVEIDHRLRCIYAWADKAHQDNQIESVLIEAGWSSRKRYVELNPKVSLPEFRVVQKEHFPHLDRVGEELLKSYREDLLVQQGKSRQNRELMRECLIFLVVVGVVDVGITLS